MRNFWLCIALVALSSCGSAPAFPDGYLCNGVWDETLGDSYIYCERWSDPNDEKRWPAERVFKKKMVLIDLSYFNQIMTWKGSMEKWAKKHCK